MVQKADIESPDPMEKKRDGRKKPLVSCDIYDEEEKSLFGKKR